MCMFNGCSGLCGVGGCDECVVSVLTSFPGCEASECVYSVPVCVSCQGNFSTSLVSRKVYILGTPGTLRPDLIESASAKVSSNAQVIKTHHNDTELVRELRKLVSERCLS